MSLDPEDNPAAGAGFSGCGPTSKTPSPIPRADYLWKPLGLLSTGLALLSTASTAVYFGFINDGWINDLTGMRYWLVVAGMTLVVAGLAPAGFLLSIPAFFMAFFEDRSPLRLQAMYWGWRKFDRATHHDAVWLGGTTLVRDHPVFAAMSDRDKSRVWGSLRGEPGRGGRPDAPVLHPATVARWVLTGEDIALLVTAAHCAMTDEALLGYLDGDEAERTAFEFLVSLAFRPTA